MGFMRLATLPFETRLTAEANKTGHNHIQNLHLGKYIVGYTVGDYVLYYTSANENFEYSCPLNIQRNSKRNKSVYAFFNNIITLVYVKVVNGQTVESKWKCSTSSVSALFAISK